MPYEVTVKALLRPENPLTRQDEADILAKLARVLREYNGGGGGRVVEVDMAVREGAGLNPKLPAEES